MKQYLQIKKKKRVIHLNIIGVYRARCTSYWRKQELNWPLKGRLGSAEKEGNNIPKGEAHKQKYRGKNLEVISATMKA